MASRYFRSWTWCLHLFWLASVAMIYSFSSTRGIRRRPSGFESTTRNSMWTVRTRFSFRGWSTRFRLDATQPLNESNSHELLSSTKKVKPSKLRSPSNAFQSRYRPSSSEDALELKKVLLTEQALTEIMSETLKHAASSMFVTSFTTAAAFCTNMITNISFVQVFGVFTGTCILLYFVITVTAIAAFAVSWSQSAASRGTNSFL